MRAFLALDLDERFLDGAVALGRDLAPERRLSRARWVKRAAMHLTLRFFGDLEGPLLDEVRDIVPGLAAERSVIDVRACALLAFPDAARARVLTIDIEAPAVVALAEAADQALAGVGIAKEPRPFRPHLTLARLRDPANLQAVVDARPLSLAGRVLSISLYESVLGPAGPTYATLASAALAS